MGVPKKKITHNTTPIKVGNEYLNYGLDRIEELMRLTDAKTKFLPRSVMLSDIDVAFFEYFNDEKSKLIIDGVTVPVFYMESDRWGEFEKTWKFMDDDKNVPTPYILIRRTKKELGSRLGGKKYRIPQPMKFKYMDVPILDDGEIIYLRFKMPQPINVDLSYEVNLFTKYRVDVNEFDTIIFKNFGSAEDYLFINGNPMPIFSEEMSESNTIEDTEGDRFYNCKYTFKVLGFIQDENEYEIVKTTRNTKISYGVST